MHEKLGRVMMREKISDEFKKLMREPQPAKIEATMGYGEGDYCKISGRGIDLLVLSNTIATEVIIKTDMDIDKYCELLKEGYLRWKRKKENDAKRD